MLISPPFLPPRGNQTEEQWLATAMSGGQPGHGAFPASYMLEWHGGMHLAAPMGGNGVALPVRAIADGIVVFIRQRTSADSPDEPLNYGDGYTSDAVVVIRHDTETGASAAGQATQVRFYSVYMHLHSIQPTVRLGRPIYRKAEIGQAGHIYGEPNVMHFEICCDDTNLAHLVGRATGNLSLAADGRTDVLFGEMYFHMPAGTPIYGVKPLPQFAQAMLQPAVAAARRGQPAPPPPAPQALAAVHTTASEFVIGLRYAGGEGAAGQLGDAVLTTYQMSGSAEGTPQREAEAEYKLYTSAKNISEAYPAAARPAISAVYELLRFGRVVGPDALAPVDVPHWREVSYPSGQGWVNLNAANVHKFSDADFPQWRGWALIDDDTNGDSRCDSPSLQKIIYDNGAACLQPSRQHATAQLNSPAVQAKLARTVCKFPSEWDASTIDQRWSWLKTQSDENPEPLTDDDYAELKAHVQALCFPLPEVFAAQWCFNPREFIGHFRVCGWMSLREITQILPRKSTAGGPRPLSWSLAMERFEIGFTQGNQRQMPAGLYLAINQAFRKYCLAESRLRQAHFFGQAFVETGALRLNSEGGDDRYFRTMYEVITPAEAGSDYDSPRSIAWRLGMVYHTVIGRRVLMTRAEYVAARPGLVQRKAQDLGNIQPGDGPRFRGRGLVQLTGRNNYASYGEYRGRDYTTDPNPTLLAGEAFVSTDVALTYWVSKVRRGININRHADVGSNDAATEQVTRAVNGGTTHIEHRREYFDYVWGLLRDVPTPADTQTLERQKDQP